MNAKVVAVHLDARFPCGNVVLTPPELGRVEGRLGRPPTARERDEEVAGRRPNLDTSDDRFDAYRHGDLLR
jgi:hypothetical protein